MRIGLEEAEIGAAALHLAASLLPFGMLIFPLYAKPDPAPPLHLPALRSLALLALVTAIGWLWSVAARVLGQPAPPGLAQIAALLIGTEFGRFFLLRIVLALIFASALFAANEEKAARRRPLLAALAGLGLASAAPIGHAAASEGALLAVRIGVQAVHLLAAGTWIGALWPLAAALRMAQRAGADGALPGLARRFSRAGMIAVALIVLTGILNTQMTTGAPLPDLGTLYGRILATKIALVALAVLLAGVNRLILTPALRAPRAAGALMRSIFLEQALLLLAILAAATLGTQSPMA